MKYDEFRDWLSRRGFAANSRNTGSSAVRQLESALRDLGFHYDELDDALEADELDALINEIDLLRSDASTGGQRYRALFPNSDNPHNRFNNVKWFLGEYAKFLKGEENERVQIDPNQAFWFVGASFGGTEEQVDRFIKQGIWEISEPSDSDRETVRSMRVGDPIAIKAAFTRKHDVPFDNLNKTVSVMRIKALGTITGNDGNGERITVDWESDYQSRDWYLYTYQRTIWRVVPNHELAERLVRFAFHDDEQDYSFFLNYGDWAEKFREEEENKPSRYWLEKTIVRDRPDRLSGDYSIGRALWSPQKSKDGSDIYRNMREVQPGDVVFHLTDNEAITGVSFAASAADDSFVGLEGTPWAEDAAYLIKLDQYEELDPPLKRDAFFKTEPFATELNELRKAGESGLFYNKNLDLNQGSYLTELTPTLLNILSRSYLIFSGEPLPHVPVDDGVEVSNISQPYTLDDALSSLFFDREFAEDFMLVWRANKNVILQGPPGVGKSFAAQKLAFVLMGEEDRSRLGNVQFHQSYSYEDFVEGYRPSETGFELRPGKFVEFCRRAEADPNHSYVYIIDEINRGNLSKILGELMLLIENDKRDSRWAMPLASGRSKFHVPANVFILGLMNTADRSLAVVDYALRRRFAFVDMKPAITSDAFEKHLADMEVSESLRRDLVRVISELNQEISNDTVNLGPGFALGHSYFCKPPVDGEDESGWYRRIIRTEIMPLLREYWFDDVPKALEWQERLVPGQ